MNSFVEITGIGVGLPLKTVDNKMFESLVDTSDEWITQRTGIKQRRIITEETVASLSVTACKQALQDANVNERDIGLLVCSTITPDHTVPTLAGSIQKQMQLDSMPAFDLSAGCTGFIYALISAASLMETLNVDQALVVAGEALSKKVDWADRSSCVLFGDAAGAVVLSKSKTPKLHHPFLMGKSDDEDVLVIENPMDDNPWHSFTSQGNGKLKMKGREVFTFASEVLTETLVRLKKACTDRPFTKIIPHQANYRIIEYVSRKTGFAKEQFFMNVSTFANTSSASIPLAMWDAYQQDWIRKGDRIALVGFGSGLTWGGIVVDWTI